MPYVDGIKRDPSKPTRTITGFRSAQQILESRRTHIQINEEMIIPKAHIVSYYPSMRLVQLLGGSSAVVEDRFANEVVNFIVDRRNRSK